MGKLVKMLEKIRSMTNMELHERYVHIVKAQALKEYLGAKEDMQLTLEVRLSGEEIMRRMAQSKPWVSVTTL